MQKLKQNMRIVMMFFCTVLIFSNVNGQHGRRTHQGSTGSGSSGSSAPFHNGSAFSSLQECEDSGCPCCTMLRTSRFVCRTHNALMPDVLRRWGVMEEITVQTFTFRVYNATQSQKETIQEILNVLPSYYLLAVAKNIRIGHPSTGGIRTSTEAHIVSGEDEVPPVYEGTPLGERIGGGSRKCSNADPDYDQIILHPLVFRHPYGNPRLTLLHEVGHFVNRQYSIAEDHQVSHRTEFDGYRTTYHGDSDSDEEVIAQGIMYYYSRKNWPGSHEVDSDGVWVNARFPQWLKDIILADIASRS